MQVLYTLCRYIPAFLVILYGFAKINGSQFTILDSELDKPMREVSGFWLTWYYFSYSAFYGNFIALVQIAGGVMLMFRRTTLLGACILFGVMANIILIDIFFEISQSALLVALFIEACLTFILWQHQNQLKALFWKEQNPVYATTGSQTVPVPVKFGLRACMLVVPALFTYFVANYNNRLPTPLDGRWQVVDVSGALAGTSLPTHIYFEHNLARMCVFRYPTRWATRHFEVDQQENAITIWNQWMNKENEVFQGSYKLAEDQLELRGAMNDSPITLTLTRLE